MRKVTHGVFVFTQPVQFFEDALVFIELAVEKLSLLHHLLVFYKIKLKLKTFAEMKF